MLHSSFSRTSFKPLWNADSGLRLSPFVSPPAFRFLSCRTPSQKYFNKSKRLRHPSRTSTSFNWTLESMEDLGDITRLSKHVVRVLGQNPGKFTLQGTNTYIIGSQNPYILIDTGEGLPEYTPVLSKALTTLSAPTIPSLPDVSDIIISHWHFDHVGGIPSVLILLKELWENRNPGAPYVPPRLHKYLIGDALKGEHNSHYFRLPKLIRELSKELYTAAPNGDAFHDLQEGQIIKEPSGAVLLRVLHTPGHTVDSICLHVPQDRALYTADTVLGHGTAVFEDLATYLASLNKMLHFGTPAATAPSDSGFDIQQDVDLEYVTLYPAHGAVIANGRETIATYIKHRLEREAQILGVLKSSIPAELLNSGVQAAYWTTWNIVRVIYKAYPENLWLPAARGIDLHLTKLEGEGIVKRVGGEGTETEWKVLVSPPSTPNL
ncbi:unnamed protein product [Cyclocybe aegerita]|uniref:Metallo-beta-lactamase domain-containing protein n=1 Tax=Cyclocybe aegerita TaxID=1973307 RepID=A0A8S0VQQ9_CYCAE|nr:unnamed protein product [Cyclocybe aegerita]